jgi:murein tripeptide amidase MpaA
VAYPLTEAAIDAALSNLATRFSSLCTRDVMPEATHQGRKPAFLKIANGSGANRPAILFTGGIHAREYAPPDALVSFAEKLLIAYSGTAPFVIPEFHNARFKNAAGGEMVWARTTIAAPDIQRIVDRCDLYIAPLINPDGRNYAMTVDKDWRKNMRPGGTPRCSGVDINRNFPFAWDYKSFYTAAAAKVNSASTDPCNYDVYVGSGAHSEPETRNLMWFFSTKNIAYYVDIHACAHMVLYSWGDDDNQSAEPSQNFANAAAWDGKRDGLLGTTYGEYMPPAVGSNLVLYGQRIVDAIIAAAGSDPDARKSSTYRFGPIARTIYTATGSAPDFCFSRQFGAVSNTIFSYTIECGDATEGGFQPNPLTEYPKIEREVHAGLLGLLTGIPTTAPAPPPPAPPAPTTPPSKSSSLCFVATAAYGSPHHPVVAELRSWRDDTLAGGGPRAAAMRLFVRVYDWVGPPLAEVIARRETLRWCARTLGIAPFARALRLLRGRSRG